MADRCRAEAREPGLPGAAGQVTRPGRRPVVAQPSVPRKASVTATATLLDCPASTRTANAMSPCVPPSREPMNQPCESGGVLLPNSAVPVLPYTSPRSASAVAVPDRTTCRIIGRNWSSTAALGPAGALPDGAAPTTSTGAAGVPLAIPATT